MCSATLRTRSFSFSSESFASFNPAPFAFGDKSSSESRTSRAVDLIVSEKAFMLRIADSVSQVTST